MNTLKKLLNPGRKIVKPCNKRTHRVCSYAKKSCRYVDGKKGKYCRTRRNRRK